MEYEGELHPLVHERGIHSQGWGRREGMATHQYRDGGGKRKRRDVLFVITYAYHSTLRVV
jgi:hypothetical protein